MGIFILKVLAILFILLTGYVCGQYPSRVQTSADGMRKLDLGNAFSAGVFLGAGLLHMLPDGIAHLNMAFGSLDFPFAMLLSGAGFLLILMLEQGMLGGSEDVGAMSKGTEFYPYILLVVLSVHSIIAGATLGLEGKILGSIALFIAIIGHKGAAAFALGISLKKANFASSKYRKITAVFSTMAPLGAMIGIMMATMLSSQSSVIFEAIFDSVAAGTFLYVATLDVMAEVFEKSENSWLKVLLGIAGFMLMAVIAVYA